MSPDALDHAVREFIPDDGGWLPLERLLEEVFSSPQPTRYYHAIFNLFERFPADDGEGVFWSAVHGMEAVGNYESLLLQYFRRYPTLMTETLLIRMKNAGKDEIQGMPIISLIGTSKYL